MNFHFGLDNQRHWPFYTTPLLSLPTNPSWPTQHIWCVFLYYTAPIFANNLFEPMGWFLYQNVTIFLHQSSFHLHIFLSTFLRRTTTYLFIHHPPPTSTYLLILPLHINFHSSISIISLHYSCLLLDCSYDDDHGGDGDENDDNGDVNGCDDDNDDDVLSHPWRSANLLKPTSCHYYNSCVYFPCMLLTRPLSSQWASLSSSSSSSFSP